MIAISNLKLAPGADEAQLRALAARALNVPPQDITALRIRKKSLDARRKDDIHYVYTVGVTVRGDERKLIRRCRGAAIVQDKTYPKMCIRDSVCTVVCLVLGILLVFNPFDGKQVLTIMMGVSLIVDGVQNLCTVVYAAVFVKDVKNAVHDFVDNATAIETTGEVIGEDDAGSRPDDGPKAP